MTRPSAVLAHAFDSRAEGLVDAATALLAGKPRIIQRMFGGLIWLRVTLALFLCNTSLNAALYYTARPSSYAATVFCLFAVDMAAFVNAVQKSPGKTTGSVESSGATGAAAGLGASCDVCNRRKPLRSSHCTVSTCNECVPRSDGHNIWLNRCIGPGNHVPYYASLATWVLTCAASTVLSVMVLVAPHSELPGSESQSPVTATRTASIVVSFLCGVYATETLASGIQRVRANITLIEQYNARNIIYLKSAGGGFYNPFDKGSNANLKEWLGIGGVDWTKDQGYTVFDIPNHPLRPVMMRQLEKLRSKAVAAAAGGGGVYLSSEEREALKLAEGLAKASAPTNPVAHEPSPSSPAPASTVVSVAPAAALAAPTTPSEPSHK